MIVADMTEPQQDLVVGLAQDHPRGWHIPRHRHLEAQLIYARSGVMRVAAADGLWVLPPQRALWMPAETVHAIDCRTAVSLRTLYFGGSMLGLVAGCRVLAVSPLLRAALLRLVEGPLRPGQGALLAQVVAGELAALPVEPLQLPQPQDRRLQRLAGAWAEDPADGRGLADWAPLLATTERSLMRLIERECGMTFRQWRRQVRLMAALEGLAQGRSVTAVGLDCGYGSLSAFIEAFRLALGTTPARYFAEEGAER